VKEAGARLSKERAVKGEKRCVLCSVFCVLTGGEEGTGNGQIPDFSYSYSYSYSYSPEG